MLSKRKAFIISIFVLITFFSFIIYFSNSINNLTISKSSNGLNKIRNHYDTKLIEHNIMLRVENLPNKYKIKRFTKDSLIAKNFIENTKGINKVNVNNLWREVDRLILTDQYFSSNYSNIGNVINSLRSRKILASDLYPRGTQLKLLLRLEGNHNAVFKPQWYEREAVIPGPVYAGKDRHGAEILAFYLAALLQLQFAPVAVERLVHVRHELLQVGTSRFNATVFERNGQACIVGKCYYCRREEPVCGGSNDGLLRGALIYHVPGTFQVHRSPWQRTYKRGKKAVWETHPQYCQMIKTNVTEKRLLDLIEVSVLDFLIQNGDRHHYQTFHDKILLIDNGKGLGNPFVHHLDVLAPLYQCCMIRLATKKRLQSFSGGMLREFLESVPEITRVVSANHLQAIEQRLLLVYATIDFCKEHKLLVYY